jgi:hypothetical protein
MSIRISSSREIETLIAGLASARAVRRDAAVARLTVIGARAVDRLVQVVTLTPGTPARVAALRALEGIGEPRAVDVALQTTDDADVTVATAAIAALRRFLHGDRSAAIVDRLAAVALDSKRAETLRVAAVRALKELPQATIAPIMKTLAADRIEALRLEAQPDRRRPKSGKDPMSELTRAAHDGIFVDAAELKRAIAKSSPRVPLTELHRIIERVREKQAAEPPSRQAEWAMIRADLHLALARRQSRLGIYDLREWLESADDPLPVDVLRALTLVGDVSCLGPVASAGARSKDEWWRAHLADAFQAIVKREKISRRNPTFRKLAKKWPAFFES